MLDSLSVSATQRELLGSAVGAYEKNVHLAAAFLSARGITEQMALSARLGVVVTPVVPEHERFRGMLAIGYLTPAGVVALKFRQLDPERSPKYDAPGGQHARLYNVAALHTPGDTVAICEGELDALVMTHVVGIPAVGVPGASHWQDHWPRCFTDYDTVLVVADNDRKEDGSNPGRKHAERVVKSIPGGRLVLPPMGLDLTEFVQRDGVDAVREACNV